MKVQLSLLKKLQTSANKCFRICKYIIYILIAFLILWVIFSVLWIYMDVFIFFSVACVFDGTYHFDEWLNWYLQWMFGFRSFIHLQSYYDDIGITIKSWHPKVLGASLITRQELSVKRLVCEYLFCRLSSLCSLLGNKSIAISVIHLLPWFYTFLCPLEAFIN